MRRLIINADDFGLTPGVNRGIAEASQQGVVTSATIMAAGSAFDDALRLTHSNPALATGCHVVLTNGTPVLRADQIPSLTDGNADLHQDLTSFVLRALSGLLKADQIEAEVSAQIRKLQSAGIVVSHLDTHKHTHIFPQVLRPLLRAARTCGVRAIRNPFGRVSFRLLANRPKLWKRYGQVKLLSTLAAQFQRKVASAGILTPDGIVGVVGTGAMDYSLFRLIVENLPHGTWEFVSHPGYNDRDLDRIPTRLRESRQDELRLLTSPQTRKLLIQSGIQLISYRDLASP